MIKENLPITTTLRIIPLEGKETACLEWMHSIAAAASGFKGHKGYDIFRSLSEKTEFINIFHFETYEDLMKWENSVEREQWVEKGKEWIGEVKSKQQYAGIDFWFEQPKVLTQSPPKYKMAILSIGVIFFFLNTLIPLFQHVLRHVPFHPLIKTLLGVVLMVSLMTWVVMPGIVKVFRRWLFQTH